MHLRRRIIRTTLFLLAGGVFLFSARMLWQYRAQASASRAVAEAAIERAVVQPSAEPAEVGLTAPDPSDTQTDSPAPTSDLCPISVDFDALLAQNPDVIGWLYCPDTPIHYPVVQAEDNSTYLRRLLDGQWNSAGTLFLDYRNQSDLSDELSLIYGHNMQNDTMFATLPNYRDQRYYDAHPVLYVLTPQQHYRLDIQAGFTADDDDAIYTVPATAEEASALIADAISRSDFTAESPAQPDGTWLALSTCTYESQNSRYLVLGQLQKLDMP